MVYLDSDIHIYKPHRSSFEVENCVRDGSWHFSTPDIIKQHPVENTADGFEVSFEEIYDNC